MTRITYALCLSLLASAQAFSGMQPMRTASVTQLSLLSQAESDQILTKANDCCYEGECSLDEVDDLIQLLKEQQKELFSRVEQVKSMQQLLEKVNLHDERKVDEVRETVRAIFRIFRLSDKASGRKNDH